MVKCQCAFRGLFVVLSLLGAPGAIQPGLAQPQLASAYRAYSLPLTSYAPGPNRVAGLLLKARINGGPALRMLLDSGATHVAIDAGTASRSGLDATSELFLIALGRAPAAAKQGRAKTLQLENLQFRDCVVDVAPTRLADGIDGVIPTSLFSDFLLHLDLPGKTLELVPFPDSPAAQSPGFTPFLAVKNLLFVQATINKTQMNQAQQGYVLLDTGACYTAISRRIARCLKSKLGELVQMRGSAGSIEGERVESGIRFQLGGEEFRTDPVIALDLTAASAYNGIEVAGLLGYPDLRSSVLTIDYRNSQVKVEPKIGRQR